MPDFSLNDLQVTARRILDLNPDPAPRLRLLRDVLRADPVSPAYREAQAALQGSKWAALLQSSQQADGTWGRYHTQDTRVKQPFPTTESAIASALGLGLDRASPVLAKLMPVLLDYVDGRLDWPDPPEKHDNPLAWYVWERHYSAAALALIDPTHPRLDAFWAIWAEALAAAFQSGEYDRGREIAALNGLLQCRMKSPVPFHVYHPLLILSAARQRLPVELERRALDFVLHHPRGIYYVYEKAVSAPLPMSARHFWSWFNTHRLLSRFPLWKELCADAANWIWRQRGPDGLWDLGSGVHRRPYSIFPLSDDWRRPQKRVIDSSVEMLALLARCF